MFVNRRTGDMIERHLPLHVVVDLVGVRRQGYQQACHGSAKLLIHMHIFSYQSEPGATTIAHGAMRPAAGKRGATAQVRAWHYTNASKIHSSQKELQ
jgi:hypothetical protein